MKVVISNIVLIASPILLNVLWPVKLRYIDLIPVLYSSFEVFVLFFIISLLILYQCQISSLYPAHSKRSQLCLMSFISLTSSLFIGSNLHFLSTNPVPAHFSHYKQLNCLGSLLTYAVLTIIEHVPIIRKKIFLVFDPDLGTQESLVSPFVYFIVSEYIGLLLVFYFIIVESLYTMIFWVFQTYPYVVVCLAVLGLFMITVGLVLFKVFKHKIKN